MPVALPVALARRRVREARARHGPGLPSVLAREESACDRVVRDHAQPLFRTEGEQFALDLAEEEIVARLDRVEARQTEVLASPEGSGHLIREVVGAPDVPGLARADHVVQRAQALFDGRR